MYVRGAKKRDEAAFRSREYVVALDESTGEKAGFGRLRLHEEVAELTSAGVTEPWRNQGVGAHVVERLIEHAGDDGFETVYALAPEPDYLLQFGFEPVERSALPEVLKARLDTKRERHDRVIGMALAVGSFSMPERLRDRFKEANPVTEADTDEETIPAEEFGIDPERATYKYDTGRQ